MIDGGGAYTAVSHFEYVSVAVALVYSFTLARLLGGLPHVAKRENDSWIALGWTIAMILVSVSSWWIFWRFQAVEWTPIRFLWILGVPSLIYLRAAILITDNPGSIGSWSDHFFEVRRRFFAMGIALTVASIFLPWIMGLYAWGTPAPGHAGNVPALILNAMGFATAAPWFHRAFPVFIIAVALLSLIMTPLSVS